MIVIDGSNFNYLAMKGVSAERGRREMEEREEKEPLANN